MRWYQVLGAALACVISLCGLVFNAYSQPTDRALVTSDSGWVEFGDPGDVFDLAPDGGRTFAFWVRSELTRYHIKLLDKRIKRAQTFSTRQWGYSFFLHQFTGTVGFYLSLPLEGDASIVRKNEYYLMGGAGLSVVADGTWHHVALVQDGQWIHVYVDAKLDFSYEAPAPIADMVTENPLWFGWNDRDTIVYEGALDEMSAWGRALSASEIHDLAYGYPELTAPDLLAYWSFDGEDPNIASDSSPNGHDGRIYNAQRVAASRPLSPPFRDTMWYPLSLGLGVVLLMAGISWLSAMRLRTRNRELETQVTERTEEIRQQAEQLRSLDETKSRFFTNVSHEFRTPLTLTIGPLKDINDGHHGPVPEPIRRPVQQGLLNSQRLLRLVNQLLDVAKIEAAQLHLNRQPLSLVPYLRVLADAFTPLAERKAITFRRIFPDEPMVVSADPEHLEKVFTNLLSNAFKFTPEGGLIVLMVSGTAEAVTVVVRDNGPGIPAAEQAHVFNRFHRAYTTHKEAKVGTGIGLALAKELVELHNGEISVTSEEGFGATFTVSLPRLALGGDGLPSPEVPNLAPATVAVAASMPQTEPATAPDETLDHPTVLVVDDNAEIRRYVRSHLEPAYHVIEAVHGADGLTQARAVLPDLIVSDVMMPEMDGYAFCRAIKADPELDFIPVILLTAKASAQSKLEGLGEGADDYLTKPFSSDELKARIHNLITQRHRLRERFKAAPATPPLPERAVSLPASETITSADATWVKEVRTVIEAHLADETFNVTTLADTLGMTRAVLYRRTQDVLETSPAAYMWQMRLERAAQLLEARAGTVSEVAYGVGFKSVQHFARRFRAHYGCTPSHYLKARTTPKAEDT